MKLPVITRLPWRKATIERAAWLADDTLLLIGWWLSPEDQPVAKLDAAGSSRTLDAQWIPYPRPDLDVPRGAGRVAVVRFPSALDRHKPGTLTLEAGAAVSTITTQALQTFTGSLADVVARGVGWLDADTRAGILAFLCETLNRQSSSSADVARNLCVVRDLLRTPLPAYRSESSSSVAVWLERVCRIDDRSFYVKGWRSLAAMEPARLTAVSPEGHRADIRDDAFTFRRDDSGGPGQGTKGFIAYIRLSSPSIVGHGWTVELMGVDGTGCESQTCPVHAATPPVIRELLLADLELDQESKGRLVRSHVAPAIARLQKAEDAAAVVDDVMQFGAPVDAPEVSIVVPLYKRIDLVEYQMAQFALDPDMRLAEITYVLDSPELASVMREGARQLHELYRVPFRVVFLTRNLGFAGANNAAVPLTSGRLLLLLNSDVMPSRPGWLARMRAFYDATPGIGSLGVKLLYEDDTLQHAGLYFRREPNTTVWENEHYFKGLEQTFAPANVTRKVPGVTGACLMISRALYLEQGGLRGMYLQGDYEDSDLCLRLLTAGYDNWYLADVALYHLEGQSYGWTGRTRASRYNAWTHTHLWDDVIRTTMAKFSA